MKIRNTLNAAAVAALFIITAAPGAIAADLSGVGYLDQAAVGSLPQFQSANAQVAAYKAQLDQQFAAAMRDAKTDADKQRVQQEFQQRFVDKQQEVLGPLFARAQGAIAQVTDKQKLSVIVDKRIVIYGGTDITQPVIALFKSSQAIEPPSATPPPSAIGFVDQTTIDQTATVRKANDAFYQYASGQKQAAMTKMKAAQTDPQAQQHIFSAYQNSLNAEQSKMLKPIADQVKSAMASVARKDNLILVVDRSDIIYGGTDITADVQNALAK